MGGCSSEWLGLFLPEEYGTLYQQGMQALRQAVYNVVMEFYDHGKPWKEDFVKFTIDFDEQGRVAAITYTPIPAEHKDAPLERVRDVCQPF